MDKLDKLIEAYLFEAEGDVGVLKFYKTSPTGYPGKYTAGELPKGAIPVQRRRLLLFGKKKPITAKYVDTGTQKVGRFKRADYRSLAKQQSKWRKEQYKKVGK